jgi:hypothetical protein
LRELWQRPYPDDEDADRQAFDAACQEVAPEIILEAAQTFARSFEPAYLPSLARWLKRRGWRRPPPERRKQSKFDRPRGGKVDIARVFLEEGDWGPLQ